MVTSVAAYSCHEGRGDRALVYLPENLHLDAAKPHVGLLSLSKEILIEIFEHLHPIPSEGCADTVTMLKQAEYRNDLPNLINMALTCKVLLDAALLTKVAEVFAPYDNIVYHLSRRPTIMRPCHRCRLIWPLGGVHSNIENWGTDIKQDLIGFKQDFTIRCPGQLLIELMPQTLEEMRKGEMIIRHQGLIAPGPHHTSRPMELCRWLTDDYEVFVGVHDWRDCKPCLRRYGPFPDLDRRVDQTGPNGEGFPGPVLMMAMQLFGVA